jgi:hypothetical protein
VEGAKRPVSMGCAGALVVIGRRSG